MHKLACNLHFSVTLQFSITYFIKIESSLSRNAIHPNEIFSFYKLVKETQKLFMFTKRHLVNDVTQQRNSEGNVCYQMGIESDKRLNYFVSIYNR